jgi:retinol dehydrogenase-12
MYHIFGPDAEFDAGLPEDTDMFDVLSEPGRTDIVWRYALSKLMVHQCFHELVKAVDRNAPQIGTDPSGVVVNVINPG